MERVYLPANGPCALIRGLTDRVLHTRFSRFLFSGHGGTRRPSGRREDRRIVDRQFGHSDQVAGRADQLRDKVGPRHADVSAFSKSAHRLHPAKGFFYTLSDALTGAIALLPGRASVDPRHLAFVHPRNVRSDLHLTASLHKRAVMIALVGAHRARLESAHAQFLHLIQRYRRLRAAVAAGPRQIEQHQQAAAILHCRP